MQKFGRVCCEGQESFGIDFTLFEDFVRTYRLGVIKGCEYFALVLDDLLQFGFECFSVPEIAHSDGIASADLV